ncbi:MAG TPA: N-6 DNA methylase, partial [Candidatus Polarisedimenticolia bacterium]|nr:N-6 DNA methylase [Candidatus Polarisedimenticolia bacterium]
MARDPAPSASSLEVIAKLAAARAVSARRLPDPHEHLAWVESGEPFEQAGVRGFLDGLPRRAGAVRTQTLRELLEALESGRSPDLGGGFMRSTPRARRHARGEYYTPAWLVERVLDRAGFDPRADERLVDPMCGAGAFLAAALARLRAARPGAPAEELAVLVRGMDVSPLAVLMARTACLVALAGAPRRGGAIRIGVDCRDAILDPGPDDPAEVVAGNPPWIGWESLPDAYRRATRHLWSRYGLFADRGGAGMQALLGRSKKDLAMLATYVA